MKNNTFKFVLFKRILIFTVLVLALFFAINTTVDVVGSKLLADVYQFKESLTMDEAIRSFPETQKVISSINGKCQIINDNTVVFPKNVKKSYSEEELISLMNGMSKIGDKTYKAVLTPIRDKKNYFQMIIVPTDKIQTNYAIQMDIYDSRNNTYLNFLLIAIIIFFGGYFLISRLVVRKTNKMIVKPISDLKEDMANVSQGSYDIEKASYEIIEFNEMRKSFEEMTETLQSLSEKAKNDEFLKSQIISELGHDIKNSITPIVGYTNILKNKDYLLKEDLDMMEKILSNCKDMQEMLGMLVEYGKLSRIDYHLNKTKIDVMEIFKSVIGEKYSNFENKNIDQIIKLEDKPINLLLDYIEIKRAIGNIIGNAATHNPEFSVVEFSYRETEFYVDLIVADTGNEIEESNLKIIFEPFIREKPTIEKQGHSGLGLSISKKIIEKHGGELLLEQHFENYTKAFIIRLPK